MEGGEGKTAGESYEDASINQCKAKMAKFVQKFAANDEALLNMDTGAPHYLQRLEEIAATEEPFLPTNCDHIQQFDEDLYRQLVRYPRRSSPPLTWPSTRSSS